MDNESGEAIVLNSTDTHSTPVYLKQSVPMMVVYTLAYSAVFFLGINLSNLDLINSVIKYHLGGIFFGQPARLYCECWLILCLCFLFIYFFILCQAILTIYRTDLHQIYRVARTAAVYERSEVSFSLPQWMLPWQPIFVSFMVFYPQNWVRVTFGRWRRTTKSANDAQDAGKPIN